MTTTAKFHLGQVLATPGAIAGHEGERPGAAFFLDRHAMGDWGRYARRTPSSTMRP